MLHARLIDRPQEIVSVVVAAGPAHEATLLVMQRNRPTLQAFVKQTFGPPLTPPEVGYALKHQAQARIYVVLKFQTRRHADDENIPVPAYIEP